ncbi:hypothetical protein ACFOLL_04455 [Falsochrobactrum ovis]|uniref:Uncharacterized protein n=1 Tax=Falsochrobactrum ovis TaxID=1293442 RepID=A0A364JVI9_9HYPH|nr:hypothetical protein [Falsochrobactrum ovis]RAK29135.1 hypothetical protein C7374_105186 [Falsochrobactrum ovis]
MAAYSKAEKRKAKRGRGRPRKEGVLRTPSGQISRAKEPPAKVAQLARMRIFGMTASEALSDLAGDNLGRLHLAWRRDKSEGISAAQYEAAERYREVYNDRRKAELSPGAYYEQGGTIGTHDPDEYEDWVIRVKLAYTDARKAIDEAQLETRNSNLYAAVQYMIEQDQYFPHMLGDIRLACNALYRHFFTQKRRKVA